MLHKVIELKNYFDFLGDDGKNPTLTLYLPYNMVEMNRQNQKRPCMLICPGGGYGMCSERESEPVALHLLPEGFNTFISYLYSGESIFTKNSRHEGGM